MVHEEEYDIQVVFLIKYNNKELNLVNDRECFLRVRDSAATYIWLVPTLCYTQWNITLRSSW